MFIDLHQHHLSIIAKLVAGSDRMYIIDIRPVPSHGSCIKTKEEEEMTCAAAIANASLVLKAMIKFRLNCLFFVFRKNLGCCVFQLRT